MFPTLGILGGGQLGRMLIQSAIDYDMTIHVLDPDKTAPAAQLATHFSMGDLKDFDTVYAFGKNCDIITIEIEKVNTDALKKLRDEGKKVYPQPEIIELIQDKRLQKKFYLKHGFPTSTFILVDNKTEIQDHIDFLPAANKLGRDGYDGKGVELLYNKEDITRAFDAPGLLEKLVDIQKEIAVIVAKRPSGEVRAFPAVEMVFHPTANLVEYQFSPAQIAPNLAKQAQELAIAIIEKLDMVGLLAVEFFIDQEGQLLVNEIAPRPHNSGHQSIEGNICSQFEQHLRAIFDLPLGDTTIRTPAAMVNLLGEEGYRGKPILQGWEAVLQESGTHLHFYGKNSTQPFRKMGHVTITDKDPKEVIRKANLVKNSIKIIA